MAKIRKRSIFNNSVMNGNKESNSPVKSYKQMPIYIAMGNLKTKAAQDKNRDVNKASVIESNISISIDDSDSEDDACSPCEKRKLPRSIGSDSSDFENDNNVFLIHRKKTVTRRGNIQCSPLKKPRMMPDLNKPNIQPIACSTPISESEFVDTSKSKINSLNEQTLVGNDNYHKENENEAGRTASTSANASTIKIQQQIVIPPTNSNEVTISTPVNRSIVSVTLKYASTILSEKRPSDTNIENVNTPQNNQNVGVISSARKELFPQNKDKSLKAVESSSKNTVKQFEPTEKNSTSLNSKSIILKRKTQDVSNTTVPGCSPKPGVSSDITASSVTHVCSLAKVKESPKKIRQSPKKSVPNSPSGKRYMDLKAKKEEKTLHTAHLLLLTDILKGVLKSRFSNSLLGADCKVFRKFLEMENHYQYLCLKLFTYQRKWYNIFKFCTKINLDYENHVVVDMYHYLEENGFVDTDYTEEEVIDLLNILDRKDIRSICENFRLKPKSSNKELMIQSLLSNCKTQCTLPFAKSIKDLLKVQIEKKMGKCVRFKEETYQAFYNAYLLGTYTNSNFENIQGFFHNIVNLKAVFPDYDIQDYIVFYTRQEFLRYADARKLQTAMEEAIAHRKNMQLHQIAQMAYTKLRIIHETKDQENTQQYQEAPHLQRYTAEHVYVKILSSTGKTLTTTYPKDAKKWLEYIIANAGEMHKIGYWYSNLAWLYMKYLQPINYEHAARLIINVLKNKRNRLSDSQIHELAARGKQLQNSKKYKIDQLYHDQIAELVPKLIKIDEIPSVRIDAHAVRSNTIGKKRNYVEHDSEGNKIVRGVEETALKYYREECGYVGGLHCEGEIVKATFTLFFWDIIYAPEEHVPGTFVTKWQQAPLDMFTDYFYKNRQRYIDQRLTDIASGWTDEELVKFVVDKWNKHSHQRAIYGEVSNTINDPDLLETLILCIGKKILAKIYDRFVKNMREHGSGLPDLLVWNPETKECKFIEVKGEGDTLSINQKLWLCYLKEIGAQVEVCHVHSIGSKRKKAKKIDNSECVK